MDVMRSFFLHLFSRTLLLALALLIVPTVLRAQNSTGSLRGEVQDESGARVAGAQVVDPVNRNRCLHHPLDNGK